MEKREIYEMYVKKKLEKMSIVRYWERRIEIALLHVCFNVSVENPLTCYGKFEKITMKDVADKLTGDKFPYITKKEWMSLKMLPESMKAEIISRVQEYVKKEILKLEAEYRRTGLLDLF